MILPPAFHISLDGPWTQAFTFLIPVPIRSKSNFRRSGGGSEWKTFKKFEEDVKFLAARALPQDWDCGDKSKALKLRPVVLNHIYAVSSLDTANLSKSLLDACEGVVFHTDASVRGLSAISKRSSKDSWGLVSFALLEPKASDSDIQTSLSALGALALEQVEMFSAPPVSQD